MSVQEWRLAMEEIVFQHDNDPKHTAKVAKHYLESINMTEAENRLLYWPSQSPDINPMEHMWAYLKKQLGRYPTRPKGCEKLWERVTVEWYGMVQDPNRVLPELDQRYAKETEGSLQCQGQAYTVYTECVLKSRPNG